MKKSFFWVVLLNLLLQCSISLASGGVVNYNYYQIVKGGYKTCKYYRTDYTKNPPEKILCNIYTYDEDGYPIECFRYNGDSTYNRKETRKFEKDFVIERAEYDSEGRLSWKFCREYNEKGFEMCHVMYSRDSLVEYQTIYKLDEKGRNIEGELINGYDELCVIYINKFDENDRLAESMEYQVKGNRMENNKFFGYDENGNINKVIYYNSEGVKYETNSVFDRKGNVIREESYWGTDSLNKDIRIFSYIYDSKGNILEKHIEDVKTKSIYKEVMKFDEYGNIIEQRDYQDDKLERLYELVFSK